LARNKPDIFPFARDFMIRIIKALSVIAVVGVFLFLILAGGSRVYYDFVLSDSVESFLSDMYKRMNSGDASYIYNVLGHQRFCKTCTSDQLAAFVRQVNGKKGLYTGRKIDHWNIWYEPDGISLQIILLVDRKKGVTRETVILKHLDNKVWRLISYNVAA
jgi:hypothetical protein